MRALKKFTLLFLSSLTCVLFFSVSALAADQSHATNPHAMSDFEFNSWLDSKYEELFPEYKDILNNHTINTFSSNSNDSRAEPVDIITKEDDTGIYSLAIYANANPSEYGLIKGTSTTKGTKTTYTQSEVYYKIGNAVNIYFGNGFNFRYYISYVIDTSAYDSITKRELPHDFTGTRNAYCSAEKSKENSSGKAYVKYKFDGLVSTDASGYRSYIKFDLNTYVGSNTASVQGIMGSPA